VTEPELMTLAVSLQAAAVDLARTESGIDPAIVDAHVDAVRRSERVLVVMVGMRAERVAIQAWTEPRACKSDGERFGLLAIKERVRR
jgi:hypothetical protein